jgi:WD40 repeat protein
MRVMTIVLAAGLVATLAAPHAATLSSQAGAAPLAPSAVVTLPGRITSLASMNRSASVVAGLADGGLVVWNGRDQAPTVMRPHTARVLAVASTADGRDVLSVATDGTLARTGAAATTPGASRRIDLGTPPTRAAAFSSDGTRLVTGGEFGEIRVFDTVTGALRQQLRGHRTELQDLAVRPGGALVASASAEADLRIWDADQGREVRFVDSDLSIFAVAFSPRDGTLASGGVDRRVTLRDASSFEPIGTFALAAPKMVATVAWSSDGRHLAVGDLDDETLSKGGVQVVDVASGAVVATLDTGGQPAGRVVFAGEGGVVIAAGARELRAWTLPANR